MVWGNSLRNALRLMCPGDWTRSDDGAERACHWLIPLGLLIGLAYAGAYRAVWRQFGEVRSLPLMPAVAVWLLDVAMIGSLLYFGAARTIRRVARPIQTDPTDATPYPIEALALVALVVLKLALYLGIPQGISGWPGPGDWRSYFNWLYAHPPYRPLILAPMWGRWAMMLVASVGRLRDPDRIWLAKLCGSLSPGLVLLWMIPAVILTSVYCSRMGRWMFGCIVACVVLAGVYVYAVIAARRQGGQTLDSIRGGGLIGEIVFLIAYAAFAGNIYAS